jgi:hypothetical protein
MEIVIDMTRTSDGTPTGTVRPRESASNQGFSGIVELLECLERIYVTGDAHPELSPALEPYRPAHRRASRPESRRGQGRGFTSRALNQ